MTPRIKARLTVVVAFSLLLAGQFARLWYIRTTQGYAAPPLLVVPRENIYARTCTRALLLVSDPDAAPVTAPPAAVINPRRATHIADATLAQHLTAPPKAAALTHPPLLLIANVDGVEHLVWARLWLPAADDGTYTGSRGAVAYVDAATAAPLAIYTGVRVQDPAAQGCEPYPAPRCWRCLVIPPTLMSAALALIVGGLVLEYRGRVRKFTLRNRR